MGHSVVTPVPALVPLVVEEPWVRSLAGVTLSDVGLEAHASGKRCDRRRGGLLFTHFGVSGPVVLDIGRPLARAQQAGRGSLELVLDLLPDVPEDQLDREIREAAQRHAKRRVSGLLPAQLPARLREAAVAVAGATRPPRVLAVRARGTARAATAQPLSRSARPARCSGTCCASARTTSRW